MTSTSKKQTVADIGSPFFFKLYKRQKVGLKLNIQKTKIMASGPNSSWQILQGEITININNTTLMAESEMELKSLLMKVKEESEKADLKFNIQKMKIMASSPITSWQNRRGNNGNSDRLFWGMTP